MSIFDESTLRKAASWQDFKEAQTLLQTGVVISSESQDKGWSGVVTIGQRSYRPQVVARTPTWFDAKCSCPANQREGRLCCHAIAVGLHLLNPIVPKPAPAQVPVAIPASSPDSVAWSVRFLGPWRKSLEKGHLSVSLEKSSDPAGRRDFLISNWLKTHGSAPNKPIQLALNPKSLSSFLAAACDHPRIVADGKEMALESGNLIHLSDCRSEGDFIELQLADSQLIMIGESIWEIQPQALRKIGSQSIPSVLLPSFRSMLSDSIVRFKCDFFLQNLEILQLFLDFSASSWFGSLKFLPAAPAIQLHVDGHDAKVATRLSASYGEQKLPRLEQDTVWIENPAALVSACRQLSARVPQASPLSTESEITDPIAIQTFLTRTLKSLPSQWLVTLSGSAQKLADSFVFVSPKILMNDLSDRSIRFSLQFETDQGEMLSTVEVRRLLRSGSSAQSSLNGRRISFSEDIESLIDPMFEELDIQQEDGSFTARNAAAEIIKEISLKINKTHTQNELHNQLPIYDHKVPATLVASLRPYQMTGLGWLSDRLKRYKGALLADDMGLGKTLQTIACVEQLFASYSQSGIGLVVVTSSLLGNWKSEFQRFAPQRKTVILHGSKRDSLRETIRPGDIVITTYSTLSRDLAWHLKQDYLVAVIDEASLIRNPDTDHSKAVAKLNCENRIALTGTPVENSARDLWAIFRFIQPGWLGTQKQFAERYEQPLQSAETAGQAGQLLRLKTSPFTLRRTKQQVAPELPSKILINEFCDLSTDQLSLYKEIQKEGQRRVDEIKDSGQNAAARMQVLTTLLRLRQACCDLALFDNEKLRALPVPRRSGKLERLLEIIEHALASGSRILIFSQFQKQLLQIEQQLSIVGVAWLRLDGQTRNRQELVDRFQAEDGPPIFLISLKAGGYGLNLTAADVVVHFDPWWNPAAEAQATDRAHRIGQTKPVTVFRLLTRGTVEEKVVELQTTKKALADSLDESLTPMDAPAWTTSELERLLKP